MLPAARNFVVPGLLYLLLGVICLALPQVAALAVGVVAGLALTTGGAFAVVFSGALVGWPGARWSFLAGFLALVLGILTLLFPALGVASVVSLLVLFFLLDGAMKCTIAFLTRRLPGSVWIALHGAAGLLLAVLLLLGWPVAADWVIGLFLGVHFLLKGWAWLIAGWGRPPAVFT
jgi:uncharacterized membrane protein HdeD (DUF308 family)